MTLQAQLYFSFRSPYSYLAIGRYRALTEMFDVDIELKPVYPLAIRQPDFFERNHPNWLGYTFRDMIRVAQFHSIPFAPPKPDPIVQDMTTRKIAEDQPHVFRLTRLGQAAAREGKGLVFADEVSRLIWGGTAGWNEGDHLKIAAEKAGLDWGALLEKISAEPDELDVEIAANQDALEASGHWGVPTLVFDGEPFFGQDRIEMVLWRMNEKGMTER
ncbi:2-hydroxychromene-2-carboxylate isomerase [Pontixanthobacter gangjinensis]|uniref:2-hydroxychromene-2-carboxylate isomerase n=1 Tax=Pontixanthobacter gangjinensis TaxID=1028742 RepID=A0A6I4SQB3_9SPHN|nr:2-hydroxychromene-2-carboxylate isomerase [Pontixanthobacter gangjinensis]MXO56772.1 2-hydroxychromene-2-carboxylate isomerase [Pontixanthobacter gangjinensis]